jgi:predicted ATPase
MKYYFYIDNFRGFSDTCIPITDVNFLVGENSTGKTSVLGLIKLLSGAQFLMSQEFGDAHVNFGHFSDMVSAHADDKTNFTIGVISEQANGKGPPVASGCLLTFMAQEGLPRLARFTFCRGAEKVVIRFRGSAVYYKREKYETSPTVEEIVETLLPQWREEHNRIRDEGYTRLSLPSNFPGRMPTLLFLSLIWNQKQAGTKNEKKADSISLVYPPMAFPGDLIWLAPIRTKPRRTYDELTLDFSPEGTHTPYLIRRLLRQKSQRSKFRTFIDKVGKASGLFQDVQIKNFGRGVTAPFELDVVLDGKALNLSTVGYGVSQSLPVLVEVIAGPHAGWFAIQQPEVHLHPRAQAVLGDLFFDLAINEHKRFLIETHSDFTLDRFRMNYKEKKNGDKPDSQILFFERRDNHNVVTSLKISDLGELPADQPKSYREFFIREEMRLLGI